MGSYQSQSLVSVVTPVYNGAEHLAESLESILAQTHQNWECIIVNNCSTDASAEIARSYAAKDSRIRVHNNEKFLRVIANHNVALRQISSSSKYCKIVFADDWIFPECLERMVAVAEENPSVGIVGAYGLRGRQVMWAGLPYPSRLIFGRDVCRKLFLEDLYVFGTPHSVLFRSELVRNHDPFYNESNLHADSEACCALLKDCDFGFVHQILTFTRLRPGSLTEFTNEVNTLIVGRLHDLVAHGPDYLTAEEFKTCLDRKLSEYYEFLARSVIRRRDKKFWDYHKRKLNDAGVGFDRARLARATLAQLFSALLNPKDTIERILKIKAIKSDPSFVRGFEEKAETRRV
jgi:glycosyltransferase involved in cell wall biosynthesis